MWSWTSFGRFASESLELSLEPFSDKNDTCPMYQKIRGKAEECAFPHVQRGGEEITFLR